MDTVSQLLLDLAFLMAEGSLIDDPAVWLFQLTGTIPKEDHPLCKPRSTTK